MRLNAMQRRKVEENVGLVHKVISDKVHGPFPVGIYTREDLFQTGCIGLCRAAATDRGGTFSTYAYRLIWNEICDLLIRSGRERKREISTGELPEGILSDPGNDHPEDRTELKIALEAFLFEAGKKAPASTEKGICSLLLMQQGYTCREIGMRMGAEANLVSAWVSKARKFLMGQEEFRQFAGEFGYGKE